MKQISVVIVTYNSERLIDECLNSLFQYNDIGENLEVIIVDNCSLNATSFLQRVNRLYPSVITIENSGNNGYGQGNNVGIMAAKASIVMIMNPDVRLKEPIFKRALELYNTNNKLILLGMQQFQSLSLSSLSYCCDWLSSNCFTMLLDKLLNKYNIFIPKFQYIAGACFFIKKYEFEQIGLFDEHIFMYGEEVDVKRRLQKQYGTYCIRYAPKLSYIHLIHGRQTSFNSFKCSIDSLEYLCNKYNCEIKSCLKNQKGLLKVLRYWYKIKKDVNKVEYFSNCIDELNKRVENIS
ncbi:hypothetical protein B5F34_11705 [Mediterranea sp. An20]|uniref:glycosyltransferase family 2 protein n=1 Tax=Mediterranea sp. An20 TaxID=1965586 RepID=UPI000B369737|nr:glycosyltransferase [Mediterranea sp. An20]OUP07247.1 hypothetical protein B5F34_11705 [Mediterranea sp. An20]